jgi:hypothetical protein
VDPGEEFVGFFREAWPYIRGHRGSTFVVVVSSEVVSGPHFDRVLQVLRICGMVSAGLFALLCFRFI